MKNDLPPTLAHDRPSTVLVVG